MITIATSQVIFDPVKEYKPMLEFEERNKDYRLISQSTTAYVYQKQKTNYIILSEETEDDTGRQDQ